MEIRVMVVDDEPLARERVRTLLASEPDVKIVAESGDGRSAAAAIRRLRPDLIFLDVQMPGMGGFEMIEKIGVENLPLTIFLTAYGEYAVKAFEVHAIDYVLKPFSRDRLRGAVQRAREQIRGQEVAEFTKRMQSLMLDVGPSRESADRVLVHWGGRQLFVKLDDVDWIEAEANYVSLHVGGKSYLLRETMSSVEGHLDPGRFIRIHRSTIVNVDRIKELAPLFHGDYQVTLIDGTRLTLSRHHRGKLRDSFGKSV